MLPQFSHPILACVIVLLTCPNWNLRADSDGFAVDEQDQQLTITYSGKRVGEYVFRDEKILRPYFANLHSLTGTPLTRNSPPIAGVDAVDHDTMHPGIWLAFGDINGDDFWRNKGQIRHERFAQSPVIHPNGVTFIADSRLITSDGKPLCNLQSQFELSKQHQGLLLVWAAKFHSETSDFTFGDQEEMGFGARLATPLIEKNGGLIVSSGGLRTAQKTWGQPASWCDYGKRLEGRDCGITLMTHPANFRESWWHNRDYGVFVANPFGRAAMKQGEKSAMTVKRGTPFTIKFAALLHDTTDYDPALGFREFLKIHP